MVLIDGVSDVVVGLACWLLAEILFYVYIKFILAPPAMKRLQGPEPVLCNVKANMRKMIAQLQLLHPNSIYSVEKFICGWCIGADEITQVKRGNIYSFIAWAFFSVSRDDALKDKVVNKKMEGLLVMLDEAFPEVMSSVEDGFNPALTHPRMCLQDSFPMNHRPLFIYLMIRVSGMISTYLLLSCAGFTYHNFHSSDADGGDMGILCNSNDDSEEEEGGVDVRQVGIEESDIDSDNETQRARAHSHSHTHNKYDKEAGLSYWVRKGDDDENNSPYVFFHGISHGWWGYVPVIRALSQNRSVVLMDLNTIKIGSLAMKAISPQNYASCVHSILRKHNIVEQVTVYGHSFGSITAGWFIKYYPQSIQHIILVDPVSVLLCLPDVAVNFLYRIPSTVMEWVIWLAASTEITIAHGLYRHFTWHHNVIWLEELPKHCSVTVLACGGDEILSGVAVSHAADCFTRDKTYKVKKGTEECVKVSDSGTITTSVSVDGVRRRASLHWPSYGHGEALCHKESLEEFAECVKKTEELRRMARSKLVK